MNAKFITSLITGLIFMSIVACGSEEAQVASITVNPVVVTPVPSTAKIEEPSTPAEEITIGAEGILSVSSIGDSLKFNADVINLTNNSSVTIEFENNSTGLEHNFVVIKSSDKEEVLADSIAAGPESGWIKPEDSRILLSTALLGPGEKTEPLSFEVPGSGDLLAVCTFPGHAAAGMVSIITIQ